ncbi:MAG: ATP-binding protein [Pseudomonadota bacterium]
MGRLFWKFFFSILLAQLAATVAIGGAVWLKNRDTTEQKQHDIFTGPPAETAIDAAAATLEFGGIHALQSFLENMDRHRVYAVNEQGRELLGRIVKPVMLIEARQMLDKGERRRAVRELKAADGHHYLLFLPSRENLGDMNPAGSIALLAGSGLPGMVAPPGPGPGPEPGRGPGPGPDGERRSPPPDDFRRSGSGPGPGDGHGPGGPDFERGARAGGGVAQAGNVPGMPPGQAPFSRGPDFGGDRPPPDGGMQRPPRFRPLAPYVPVVAAVMVSLLFAALLAWYFSRPIRSLRQAFEAASHGDLAPRFSHVSGKRGDELSDLGRDFDRMTARLRSLIDGQTRLLHDVSHELRSPLARLQAAIGLAHQQPDKMRASLERIEREGVRMDKLVGELLTLARLEAGALNAAREEISMADLLDEIVGDAEFEAASHDRAIELEGEADVAVTGQADLLARAIENIVRNAIKHSPAGGIVRVELQVDAIARRLRIRVLDRGPGVAPADLQAIFEPFFRSSDTPKDVEGHGLGLAIARQVVQAHGGGIAAENRHDGGLCVEIMLPVAQRA